MTAPAEAPQAPPHNSDDRQSLGEMQADFDDHLARGRANHGTDYTAAHGQRAGDFAYANAVLRGNGHEEASRHAAQVAEEATRDRSAENAVYDRALMEAQDYYDNNPREVIDSDHAALDGLKSFSQRHRELSHQTAQSARDAHRKSQMSEADLRKAMDAELDAGQGLADFKWGDEVTPIARLNEEAAGAAIPKDRKAPRLIVDDPQAKKRPKLSEDHKQKHGGVYRGQPVGHQAEPAHDRYPNSQPNDAEAQVQPANGERKEGRGKEVVDQMIDTESKRNKWLEMEAKRSRTSIVSRQASAKKTDAARAEYVASTPKLVEAQMADIIQGWRDAGWDDGKISAAAKEVYADLLEQRKYREFDGVEDLTNVKLDAIGNRSKIVQKALDWWARNSGGKFFSKGNAKRAAVLGVPTAALGLATHTLWAAALPLLPAYRIGVSLGRAKIDDAANAPTVAKQREGQLKEAFEAHAQARGRLLSVEESTRVIRGNTESQDVGRNRRRMGLALGVGALAVLVGSQGAEYVSQHAGGAFDRIRDWFGVGGSDKQVIGVGPVDIPRDPTIPTIEKEPTVPAIPTIETGKPLDYNGEKYPWGWAENQFGAKNATTDLMRMIADARESDMKVNTFGDLKSSHWGIASVTVDGHTYYDTKHILAALQQGALEQHDTAILEDLLDKGKS